MRVLYIPQDPLVWLLIAGLVVAVLVVAFFRRLFPSATKKALADPRYHQALAVYVDRLPGEDPTREERWDALDVATRYLIDEHGVAPAAAGPNLRRVVQQYDREQSYDLRHQGIAHEEAGEFEQALVYYERAARLQEQHDRADYEFLQRCVARVRGKVRPR
jgi:hypothetical protein